MLTLLSMGIFTLPFNVVSPSASLPVHNMDTGEDFATIQGAIDASETLDGHTIMVDAGTYFEHVVVNKSVSLIGEHSNMTIIDGNMTGDSIHITRNNVMVSHFTIQNGAPSVMIESDDNVITDNVITDSSGGISLKNSSGNTISNNLLSYGGCLYLIYSENNTIWNNTVTECFIGVQLSVSDNNHISGNLITSNFDGMEIWHSERNQIHANSVTQNRNEGISLHYSQTNNIFNNVIGENLCGVRLRESNDNVVVGNTISLSETRGVWLLYSFNNLLYHNSFDNNFVQTYTGQRSNVWDDGYPLGGNYWSDYTGEDIYSGPSQNEAHYDWIGDSPYFIDENNQDNYPLIHPYVPEMEETRIAYRNLLLIHSELRSDFDVLNSTLHRSIDDIQEQIDLLNSTLQISVDELQGQIDSLNSTLISGQEAILKELVNTRNLLYVFITATISLILIATIVYFAFRKPETKALNIQ